MGSIFWKTPDTALYSTYVSASWDGPIDNKSKKMRGPLLLISLYALISSFPLSNTCVQLQISIQYPHILWCTQGPAGLQKNDCSEDSCSNNLLCIFSGFLCGVSSHRVVLNSAPGDSHLEISVIPMLGHPLYTVHVSTAVVPEPGKDLWLFCQCKGGPQSNE